MILDRTLQLEILKIAENHHPNQIGFDEIGHLIDPSSEYENRKLASNIRYLEGHGLIEPNALTISMDEAILLNVLKLHAKAWIF